MKFDESLIHGSVEPGFQAVKDAFLENFRKRKEVGAACAVYHKGQKVVDLFGGIRDIQLNDPWKDNTMILVFSMTKGISGMALALAHSRGYFDYNEKVAKYWPEFAKNGKEKISIRQLLSHQAGLCVIDEPLDREALISPDKIAAAIAKQKPLWEPGTKHGYHAVSLGWYESELIRRTDPKHRTIGCFIAEEIAKPLGIEFYIGLPDSIPDSRIALNYGSQNIFLTLLNIVKALTMKHTLAFRAFSNPKIVGDGYAYNTREIRRLELPASNGIGLVRDMAKLYGIFATGGKELGIRPETLNLLIQPAHDPEMGRKDAVLRLPMRYSLGFLKPLPEFKFGTNEKAFGTPGAGGSFGYADPETGTGFAYAMNKLGNNPHGDPRERSLSKVVFECINQIS